MIRIFRRVGNCTSWAVIGLMILWATGALYFDFPFPRFHIAAVCALLIVICLLIVRIRKNWQRQIACLGCFVGVLVWWLSLKPANQADWQHDLDRTAWVDVNGNELTFHNFRNCAYRTESDYTCSWETRTIDLSQVRGADLFFTHWGSPWIAHPIVSFQVGDDGHIAISIEARYKAGQTYSPIRGFFRQFELIFVVADERDVIRLRTNYRNSEEVRLYHFNASPQRAQETLMNYVKRINELNTRPEWYNALTNNCTTNVYSQAAEVDELMDNEQRGLVMDFPLNGKDDEKAYKHGAIAGDLPFPELQQRALINPAAHAAGQSPDFSRLIRMGRPGFDVNSGVPTSPFN